MRFLIITCLLLAGTCQATPDDTPLEEINLDETSLEEATTTIINYSLDVQDSSRGDHQLWFELVRPVVEAFIEPESLEPYTDTPPLTARQQKACDLLVAYAHGQNTLPGTIQQACTVLDTYCHQPRRIPGFEERSFSATALTTEMKRSRSQNEHRRLTSTEFKRQQRFVREQNIRARQEMRLANHLKTQTGRLSSHGATSTSRANTQYAEQSRKMRKQMREKQKEIKGKKQVKTEHNTHETERQLAKKQRLERARDALLNEENKK